MSEHDIETRGLRVGPHPHGFIGRILAIVVEIHDVFAARLPPAAQDGVVFAVVARVLHLNDRHLRLRHEPATHLCGAVAATVVDQHDFMAALDLPPSSKLSVD
jgi:hypothetical protein